MAALDDATAMLHATGKLANPWLDSSQAQQLFSPTAGAGLSKLALVATEASLEASNEAMRRLQDVAFTLLEKRGELEVLRRRLKETNERLGELERRIAEGWRYQAALHGFAQQGTGALHRGAAMREGQLIHELATWEGERTALEGAATELRRKESAAALAMTRQGMTELVNCGRPLATATAALRTELGLELDRARFLGGMERHFATVAQRTTDMLDRVEATVRSLDEPEPPRLGEPPP